MKRRDLVARIQAVGFAFLRSGRAHDIYARGSQQEAIPRHREINENLARAILKRCGA